MCKKYSDWDRNDQTFRSLRPLDKEDRNAEAKNQPAKAVIPTNFSQIMTFVSFCIMSLTQNKRFFELEPTGTEDNPLREPMELILERDTRKNQWNAFLVQFFLDAGRFSLGAAEICWLEEMRKVRLMQEEAVEGPMGLEGTRNVSTYVDVPTFVGNKVYPVSPYRFFPDTRLPITRYQEGEFCGSEDSFSLSSLQRRGDCINLDKIPKFDEKSREQRKATSRWDDETLQIRQNPNMGGGGTGDEGEFVTKGNVVVTKVCTDITPKNFKVDQDTPLGTEDFPLRYIVWYANDATIIKFEEAYYLHGQFPYVCAQFLPDQHKTLNESLADFCNPVSNLISWLINAHVTSIRSTIEGKFIVDPAGIDVKSLESRSPYIFLKQNASQTGVDRYIQQFQVQDVTGKFMDDASGLKTILEEATGWAGPMQGQWSQGRRSATQDKVVAQGGSARGKMTLSAIWDGAFEPLGRQLIANNRQEMDLDTFSRIVGAGPHAVSDTSPMGMTTEELFKLFKADPISIATSEDFFVFDGTTPSEKAFLAQSLQEIMVTILSNPQVSAVLGFGPEQVKALFQDIYTLRGVTPSRLPAPRSPASPAIAPMPSPQPEPSAASSGYAA